VHALCIASANCLGDSRPTDGRRQAQLVAAGHKDAIALVDVTEIFVGLAVLSRYEMQDFRVLAAKLAEQLLVIPAGILKFGGRRDDADTCILTTADVDESIQDLRIIEFFFCAANRDDEAAIGAGDVICGAHELLGGEKGGHSTQETGISCP